MLPTPPTMTIPLKADDRGTIRVSGTRVTLETLIHAYQRGETPDEIHNAFSTVPLADVHSVIAYYLTHQDEVDQYMAAQQAAGEEIRRKIEASYTPEQWAFIDKVRAKIEERRDNATE